MIVPIFGFELSLTEVIAVATIIFSTIGGYYILRGDVKSVGDRVDKIEQGEANRARALEDMSDRLEKKLEPLHDKVRLQEQTQAALNATLISIQAQLSTVGSRLDTIISHMLTSKD